MNARKLLMGNEAIAYGAVEAGLRVACAYPGTPSSEVLATLAALSEEKGFYTEWSVNEKVALETAIGASYAGLRALAAMKQVGLNVAADPLMSLAYIGVDGGLVLIVADDPGPHSSQTEQDTRMFARFAKLPVLDPATPEEAREMTRYAFELSESLGLPVILRPTTRTCHACQDIDLSGAVKPTRQNPRFKKDSGKVIFPSLSARRHPWLNERQELARGKLESSVFNDLMLARNARIGIIADGISYNYVREALGLTGINASVLKIGTPYPLPGKPVLELFEQAEKILVVEEQEPVVEEQVISLAWHNRSPVVISGKHDRLVPREGELNVDKVKSIIAKFASQETATSKEEPAGPPVLPLRTPVLCAGCPHRASFYAFKKAARDMDMDAVFSGDIGCYTLGAMPPLSAMDTCLCMGASITLASGLYRAEPHRRQVAFLGDSTFFHTGVPGLINAVYNQAGITLVVLDNSTTAMTGFQPHPGTGRTAAGAPAKKIDLAELIKACGVEMVLEADPYDLQAAGKAASEAMSHPGPAVVIMKRKCANLAPKGLPRQINPEKCVACGICLEEFGCPAIGRENGRPVILKNCAGCGVCAQICPAGAIEEVGQEDHES